MKRGHLIVLLVEDDEHDIYFARQAMAQVAGGHVLHAVHDGAEATEYLLGENQFADRVRYPLPNVILTDLKMPGMDGFDLLRWLRTHQTYAIIPSIVYSSSADERDVRRAYHEGANAYIQKPHKVSELATMFKALYEFWSRCECPPPRLRSP